MKPGRFAAPPDFGKETKMLAAIAEGKNFRQSNTEVIQNADGCSVYLFGYEIARINSKTNAIYTPNTAITAGYRPKSA